MTRSGGAVATGMAYGPVTRVTGLSSVVIPVCSRNTNLCLRDGCCGATGHVHSFLLMPPWQLGRRLQAMLLLTMMMVRPSQAGLVKVQRGSIQDSCNKLSADCN
jgi:hypothetical protein